MGDKSPKGKICRRWIWIRHKVMEEVVLGGASHAVICSRSSRRCMPLWGLAPLRPLRCPRESGSCSPGILCDARSALLSLSRRCLRLQSPSFFLLRCFEGSYMRGLRCAGLPCSSSFVTLGLFLGSRLCYLRRTSLLRSPLLLALKFLPLSAVLLLYPCNLFLSRCILFSFPQLHGCVDVLL